uniref:CAP-Gly domain-containing linker protein 1-like n=1 Tax=Saccoglossus kowalevskii TaxID=10224 RepID=A0ABM0M9T3_SACKO|nr:PREDICTED: CAP-Gly domain-containing linker protein 1-like [Saccoglossus kowalevskii]
MKPTQASQYAHHLAKNLVSSGRSSPSDSDQLDDYIIGDRVLVGGTKPGIIQFLGETRFAAGQWAGVVLDEPVGKNDGSVAGVRYFQCEPKKGVFSKVSKLIREPAGGVNAGSPSHHRPSGAPSTPRMGTKVGTKLPPSGRATGDAPDNLGLKVGDRVLVSGTKLGTLRYVGTTEFAKGEWCGVELDDELGKNDGAVAGTRYFTCKARHGLFAPIHKVTRAKGKAAKPPSTPMESTSKDKRSDSTSSVSSVSSLSSLSRSIGHGSVELTSPREKELKKQAETELAALRALHEKYVKDTDGNQDSLRTLVEAADREKVELSQQLEEERRKVEDLQFRLEEAAISKDDLKAASQQELQRIHTLEDRLVEENQRATKLQMEVDGFKNVMENKDFKLTELEMEALTYIEQIEDLQKKFKAAEDKILLLESSKLKDSELGEEIKQHINKIKELELQVLSLSNDKTEVQTTLSQVREELQDSVAARKKLESTVDGLQSKLKGSESTMENMDKEVHNLKNSLSDLQRQLKSSEEKCDLLSQDKSKLESEMSEMMKHSGDSSQQLTILNEQLRAKDRKLEELQESVSQSAQTVSKLNDTIVQNKEQSEKEAENTKQKHHQKLQDIQDELEKVQGELQKANIKIAKLVENHSKEREDLLQGKDSDIDELKMKLHSKEEELKQWFAPENVVELKELVRTI